MAAASQNNMEYGFLSQNCGLKVSKLCFGAMTFGSSKKEAFTLPGQADEKLSIDMLDRFFELGGNFVDTANSYSGGASEDIIGKWMKKRGKREDVVLATKGFFMRDNAHTGPNDQGATRKNLVKSLDESLESLQTEYIDLYQVHSFDFGTPLKETLMTLNDFVRCGKVRYIAASNYGGWQLQKALDMSEHLGLEKFTTLQNQFNLLTRDCEGDVFQVCKNEGVGVIPWSPLKYGLLTDKYSDRQQTQATEGSRQKWASDIPFIRQFMTHTFEDVKDNPAYWELMDTIKAVGKEHGKNIAQVSLKWLVQRPPVTSVIIGAKTMKQLEENMEGGMNTWTLTQEQVGKIEKASDAFYRLPYPYSAQTMFNMGRINIQEAALK